MDLSTKLNAVEAYSRGSKVYRLSQTPFRYIFGQFYKNFIYKTTSKGKLVNVKTFWGDSIDITLPACFDIYLCGAKTHESELRLMRYMLKNLTPESNFLDIGSHIGFFALLAAKIAEKGKTIAIEASQETYKLLQKNTASVKNITALHLAASNENGMFDFFEFPILYSEFNTMEQNQYESESWYKNIKPHKIQVQSRKGSDILKEYNIHPTAIKIDVEGAEDKVIEGLFEYLDTASPAIIMEFAAENRNNKNHIKADFLLLTLNYLPYAIDSSGDLVPIKTFAADYIAETGLESDNIVYLKRNLVGKNP